jgi:hypothetical protein
MTNPALKSSDSYRLCVGCLAAMRPSGTNRTTIDKRMYRPSLRDASPRALLRPLASKTVRRIATRYEPSRKQSYTVHFLQSARVNRFGTMK